MNRSGFTLLEVLIALSIFAIVFAGTYNLLNKALFTEKSALTRLDLVLASTEMINLFWDTEPEETSGWVEAPDNMRFDSYKIEKIPMGIFGIKRVYWRFKKDGTTITYTLYY